VIALGDYLPTAIALASVGQALALVPPKRQAFAEVPISVQFGVPTKQGWVSVLNAGEGFALAFGTAASIGGALEAVKATKLAMTAKAKRLALMRTPIDHPSLAQLSSLGHSDQKMSNECLSPRAPHDCGHWQETVSIYDG
jgi:hypothetical protein